MPLPSRFRTRGAAQTNDHSSSPNAIHPRILRGARSSGRLDLANRDLTIIPESVYHLHDFDHPVNAAARSADGDSAERWWENVDLTHLLLAFNAIKALDHRIANLAALRVVDLSNNQLAALPLEFSQLTHLTHLNLAGNQLTSLPAGLYHLPLHELKLGHNQLGEVPVGDLSTWATTLVTLDLADNSLTVLPETLGQLAQLTTVSLARNRIAYLPQAWWQHWVNLERLDVSDNCLRCLFSMPSQYATEPLQPLSITLPRLTELDAHGNGMVSLYGRVVARSAASTPPVLMDLTPLALALPSLRELNLAYNGLDQLGPLLRGCRQLLTLDIRNNHLSQLPSGIVQLDQLSRLDISNNDFRQLPPRLGHLESLRVLHYVGNPLRAMLHAPNTSTVLVRLRNRMTDAQRSKDAADPPEPCTVVACPVADGSNSKSAPPPPALAEAAPLEPLPSPTQEEARPLSPLAPVDTPLALAETTAQLKLITEWVVPTVAPVPEDAGQRPTWAFDPQSRSARVSKLDLTSQGLSDLLPCEVAQVTFDPEDVQLADNALTSFPSALVPAFYATLTYLNLSRNQLAQFPWWTVAPPNTSCALPALPCLRLLDLSFNAITTWPLLTQAYSADTTSDPLLTPFPQLEELNLGDNQLTETAQYPLRWLFPKLTILHLNHNKIGQIPFATAFQGLTRLNLANNDLGQLPPTLGLNTSLQVLYLEGNRFRIPKPQLLRQGTQAILEYLRDRMPQ
ncbi:hypothetical protein H4R34_002567 [Dimargaris verticillata]|uniref:Leucine-rich repeat-containing protein 40 n=1 Tax=Dimargaris verticillata TaxID=2761393 RepID=A0A9W8B2I9_9FUNG|nr:hypothetical protein H4R34_002567 [Dimargaris verticillata]